MTTIVLADDHPVVLRGLRGLLGEEPDLQVVGEATDGWAALEMIERLRPDVAVVDLSMPGLHGLEIVRQAASRSPATRVIIFTMHALEAYVLEGIRSGAAAYVLKESGDADLVRAVREVAAGGRFLSRPLVERALDVYLGGDAPSIHPPLSPRESQVLQLAATGLSNAEIAARLAISPRTAETMRSRAMRKLGLRGPLELFRYALGQGILPPGPGPEAQPPPLP